jgi:hypothetical protein
VCLTSSLSFFFFSAADSLGFLFSFLATFALAGGAVV